jgi:hypothetical protein
VFGDGDALQREGIKSPSRNRSLKQSYFSDWMWLQALYLVYATSNALLFEKLHQSLCCPPLWQGKQYQSPLVF